MIVTLKFENRTAAEDTDDESHVDELRVDRSAVKQIMMWYGAFCGGDDYDVFVNGRKIGKDQNGEFEPLTIEAA